MEKVGQLLKKNRELQGFSINEISTATKISSRIIKALEESDYDNLPPKTFIRGFVQTYAGYLKLDVREVMDLYREETGPTNPPKTIPIATEKNKPHWSERLPFMQGYSVTSKGIAITLILVLIVIIISVKRIIDKYEKESEIPSPGTVATLPISDLENADSEVETDTKDVALENTDSKSVDLALLKELELEAQQKKNAAAETGEAEKNSKEREKEDKQRIENEKKKEAESLALKKAEEEKKAAVAAKKLEEDEKAQAAAKKLEEDEKAQAAAKKLEEDKKAQAAAKKLEEDKKAQAAAKKLEEDKKAQAAAKKLEEDKNAQAAQTNSQVSAEQGTDTNANTNFTQDVIIEALDKVTLRFRVDEKKSETVKLKPEQLYQIKAESSIALSISDGGSINVIHNGRDRGVPGELGRPINLKFPK